MSAGEDAEGCEVTADRHLHTSWVTASPERSRSRAVGHLRTEDVGLEVLVQGDGHGSWCG